MITSDYEGLPYSLIEAMSHGLIIISYKVGEIPNIIENGKNGFLVNDINEMDECIKRIKKMSVNDITNLKKESLKTFNNLFGKKGGDIFLHKYYQ